jgi:hypothetical protein
LRFIEIHACEEIFNWLLLVVYGAVLQDKKSLVFDY